MTGKETKEAWDQWESSAEGEKCLDPSILREGQQQYLSNRLWRAFMAGVKAAEKRNES